MINLQKSGGEASLQRSDKAAAKRKRRAALERRRLGFYPWLSTV
uniref:Uncharacterized protein n=1 Tax=Arundo donax TaxID=35708 RepID=A0A0A9EXL0_ARUDO